MKERHKFYTQVQTDKKHVGLNNVYQRLVFFYGETVKITFSSIPYYENIVQIRIPFIYPIPDFEEEHH